MKSKSKSKLKPDKHKPKLTFKLKPTLGKRTGLAKTLRQCRVEEGVRSGDAQAAALQDEVWVDIDEFPAKGVTRDRLALFPGLQWPRVSSCGRFRDTHGVVKTPNAHASGHKYVEILTKQIGLHCLVCRAFHGKPPTPKHTEVQPIDGDRSNARADNLRWVTHSQTMRHSYATNKNRRSSAPQRSKPVLGRLLGAADWVKYDSQSHAAKQLGLHDAAIGKNCKGIISQTGGYEFQYDAQAAAPDVLEGEVWADIDEFPEKGVTIAAMSTGQRWPRVSNFGRFRDLRGIVKTPNALPNSGYKYVQALTKTIPLHCLVCRAFHGEPPTAEHTQVEHIDGDPGNNMADNLRWVTHAQIIQHSYAINKNRRSSAPQLCKPVLGRPVAAENQAPAPWVKYDSAAHAAQTLGFFDAQSVRIVCSGKRKQTRGYEFQFDVVA